MIKCESDIKLVKDLSGVDNIVINKLPQLYRCSFEFAREQGSDQLNAILDQFPIPAGYKYASIDTRSHMLMKDMYPCIPGWHCDDFYRTAELHQQPDLENVHKVAPAIHYMAILGDCSLTEFMVDDVYVPPTEVIQKAIGDGEPIYKWCDETIDSMYWKRRMQVEPGKIYSFGPTAFHRGMAATHNGWRYFIRISFSNHREPKNEVRYQTQVYTNGRVGW
jgi:hypothetical protein